MTQRTFKEQIGTVFNEATVRQFEVDPALRRARLALNILTLPAGDGPAGAEVELVFSDVTRIAVALRNGLWNDESAPVVPVALHEVGAVIQSFGPGPIYGDDFLDPSDPWFGRWRDRLSLDWRPSRESSPHSFDFFQAGDARHVDVRLWFEELLITDPKGVELDLEELVTASDRWWAAMRRGDPRTASSGIIPLES